MPREQGPPAPVTPGTAPTKAQVALQLGAAAVGSSGDAATYRPSDRITVALLAALRAGSLVLGGAEVAGGEVSAHSRTAMRLLVGLTAVSGLTFARAVRRLTPQRARRPFDNLTVVIESVTGVAALLILARVTHAGQRSGSGFWVEPYTVISAVIIAAAASRLAVGLPAVALLTGAYLVGMFSGLAGPSLTGSGDVTAAWTNAMSYVAFFVVAAMGFRLLRSITGQAETLRQMIVRLSAERARVAAAGRIYQIGHDIPKALLREVKRGTMTAEQLRQWAPRFRSDLLAEVSAVPREQVNLRNELDRVASVYAVGTTLDIDLKAMNGQPSGLPALLMAEAFRELLNNASYHRYGYPVHVIGSASDDRVEVSVHNGGPGVEPRMLASAWALKQNAIHQFEAAGGSYRIDSESPPADGTTVVLRYPGEA
jgi:hypothetical protein